MKQYNYKIEMSSDMVMSALLTVLSEYGDVSTIMSKEQQPVKKNAALEAETVNDHRRAFMMVHQHSKLGREAANGLIRKYGATRMVDLDPKDHSSLLADAKALLATVGEDDEEN